MSRGIEDILLPLHSKSSTPWHHRLRGRPLVRWLSLFALIALGLWLLGPYILDVADVDRERFALPKLDAIWGSGSGAGVGVDELGEGDHEVIVNGSKWNRRREEVKDAYLHAYKGYMEFAFPFDELLPISRGKVNKFNGWAVTMLDSIDTMWLMGLKDEYNHALEVVANQTFLSRPTEYAPFFETIIRYLGGLLSAYALTKEPIFLIKADELGTRLLPAFDAYESGLPAFSVDTRTGRTQGGWSGGVVLWAEAMSCQVEYKYLAKLTGRREYYEKVERVMELMYDAQLKLDGLFPDNWSSNGMPIGAHLTIGAAADSGYEYFLKQWILTGDAKARKQYIKSANAIIDNLLYITPARELLYIAEMHNRYLSHHHEHLACFFPGLLALGVHTLGSTYLTPQELELHMWAAKGLANTCWTLYADQETGLGPDGVRFEEDGRRWVEVVGEWEAKGRPKLGEPRVMDLVEDYHAHAHAGGIKAAAGAGGQGHGHGHDAEEDLDDLERRAESAPREPPGVRRIPSAVGRQKEYMRSEDVYLLRPETVESLYIMWKVTGDPVWREMGYSIFTSIQRWAKTPTGYASVERVNDLPPVQKDDMPSFFLAETLKYLYLLFDEQDPISLDEWVFNTEAHPLPVFKWTEWEKERYGILNDTDVELS
ncbi:hypothetical protein AX16_008620 [Volvariella volvacea WC 439]|nr:hypothetical protein AX16_008620 [Volvariella volvacea WC 439]